MEELAVHLKPYDDRGAIRLFVDRSRIRGGSDWEKKIGRAVAAADLAFVLVSSDSLASRFIDRHELRPLLSRGARILPVLVRAAKIPPWLAHLQFANDAEPIKPKHMHRRDEIWLEMVEEMETSF